jgi:Protein of unknown function (DUF3551)
MRLPIMSLAIVAAALLVETPATSAQSAYSYPWCGIYQMNSGSAGMRSCYYTSYQQCMLTFSDHSGYCVQSPHYRGQSVLPTAGRPRHRRH